MQTEAVFYSLEVESYGKDKLAQIYFEFLSANQILFDALYE